MIKTVNPFNHQVIEEYSFLTESQLVDKMNSAFKAFGHWKKTSIAERAEKFIKLAHLLRQQVETHAQLITAEMGKPITEARAEVTKCATVCEYYAQETAHFLKPEIIISDASKSYARFDPIGAVLAIMPWNFPYWQVFRFAAPTLMAGNVAFLKHAPNTTGCALAIEKLFLEAGFSEGIFQTLIIDIDKVPFVLSQNIVQAVALTGSERAGASVASIAGQNIKKSVLELGGSDPFVVLPDADITKAVQVAVQSRMLNSGQSCIAAKRFFVHQSILDDFMGQMKNKVESLKVGNPLEDNTQIGPMARRDLADGLGFQVNTSINMGAHIITGGKQEDNFYTPSIITNVRHGMPAYNEELFGPVATVIPFSQDEEAISIANASPYGLGASIWTQDIERAERLAAQIDSGCVFVNALVRSDPRLPFGGIKKSGFGRELSGYGIKEFVNIKTIYIA